MAYRGRGDKQRGGLCPGLTHSDVSCESKGGFNGGGFAGNRERGGFSNVNQSPAREVNVNDRSNVRAHLNNERPLPRPPPPKLLPEKKSRGGQRGAMETPHFRGAHRGANTQGRGFNQQNNFTDNQYSRMGSQDMFHRSQSNGYDKYDEYPRTNAPNQRSYEYDPPPQSRPYEYDTPPHRYSPTPVTAQRAPPPMVAHLFSQMRVEPMLTQTTIREGPVTIAELMGQKPPSPPPPYVAPPTLTPMSVSEPVVKPVSHVSSPQTLALIEARAHLEAQVQVELQAQAVLARQEIDSKRTNLQHNVSEVSMKSTSTKSSVKSMNMESSGKTTGDNWGNKKHKRKTFFAQYCTHEDVSHGLKTGQLFKGQVRINQRNYEEAFVPNPDKDNDLDIMLIGLVNRNRALHADIVVCKLKPKSQWRVHEGLYARHQALKQLEDSCSCAVSEKSSSMTTTCLSEETTSEDSIVVIVSQQQIVPVQQPMLTPPTSLPNEQFFTPPSRIGEDKSRMDTSDESVTQSHQYSKDYMIEVWRQMKKSDSLSELASSVAAFLLRCPNVRVENASLNSLPGDMPTGAHAVTLQHTCKPVSIAVGKTSTSSQVSNAKPVSPNDKYKTIAHFHGHHIPDECLQKTAQVVYIMETKHSRTAVGQLRLQKEGYRNAVFAPTDPRIPRMVIMHDQLPKDFAERSDDFSQLLYIARIQEWTAEHQMPRGELCKSLGQAGELKPETEGILSMYNICTDEFPQIAMDCLPKVEEAGKWTIPEWEYSYRRDLRDEIIFTIDPATARDLDDALHVKSLDDGHWEVGVHIADVAFFINEKTALDDTAAHRATSVYLVDQVVPMLPRLLCEELCSLNPAVDRLAFSVIWKMDSDANVVHEWFGRTIIRSCAKLNYDVAQGFLDFPDRMWETSSLPLISDGRTPSQICHCTNLLQKIATKLREKRFKGGALRLDQPKLSFALDDQTGLPNACSVYKLRDSNRLIEEFMLMANMAVARHIYTHYPEISMLRRHPMPNKKVMQETMELAASLGLPLNGASSSSLQQCLQEYSRTDSPRANAILCVLNDLCMKPMMLAKYFCTGEVDGESEFHHYALNVPFYTHFTSPIRRYPDVIVHRLLAASLDYGPAPDLCSKEVQSLADHCNDKKTDAKAVSDLSAQLFFGVFIKECGPIHEQAVVTQVMDHSFDVLLTRYGITKRVYLNKLEVLSFSFMEGPPPVLELIWSEEIKMTVNMCKMLSVKLSATNEPLKYLATIGPDSLLE